MGLITKNVIMKWNGKNKKWFVLKGYIFTKIKDTFKVKVEDLMNGSEILVVVKCDCKDCSTPIIKPITYRAYSKCVKEDNKYYCCYCAKKLYATSNTKKTKLKNGISFE